MKELVHHRQAYLYHNVMKSILNQVNFPKTKHIELHLNQFDFDGKQATVLIMPS